MKKNTIIKILVALVVCAAAFFGIKAMNKPQGVQGSKEISIKIENQGEEVGNITSKTDAEFLSEFLLELNERGEIKLISEDSEYGMYITGLGITEAIEQNETDGLYWIYSSDNNKACQATGYGCDAANAVAIENGDQFTFSLVKF